MPRKHPRPVPLDDVVRTVERWNSSLSWPAPIDERLNALLKLAVDAGESDALTRSELLAAFVLATPADGERLVELLRLYRRATVRETLVRKPADNDANVIMLSQRHPGRR
jgi:hypothetical protein